MFVKKVLTSGGAPIEGSPIRIMQMEAGDILKKFRIAYLKDIEEVHMDAEYKDRDYGVYKHVISIADSLKLISDASKLPAIQVVGDRVIDGAHRMNAINVKKRHDPSWEKVELTVLVYDEYTYKSELKRLSKKL